MDRGGFANIIIIVFAVILFGAGAYFALNRQTVSLLPASAPSPSPAPTPGPKPAPIACTQEAKQCPDGSYVFRTGKNCEFAECPTTNNPPATECKKDSDCFSNYICEAMQGAGTACSSDEPDCKPTFIIIKGACKLKVGGKCDSDEQCQSGLLCHAASCTNPIGRQCSGSSDTSCPSGYQCVQSCGPPVSREGDPPPPYYCELNEYAAKPRICPICLAGDTMIDTPQGLMPVKDMRIGMPVWTTDKRGRRVYGVVEKISKVPVPPTHQMVHLVLDDGRELLVSPGHPTIDGRTAENLAVGYFYDGARVVTSKRIAYGYIATYDILPSGETGFYWANGILLKSTLR